MSHQQPVTSNHEESTAGEGMGSATPKQYPCFHCDRVFPASSGLERHMRSHNQKKPIFCSVCTTPFLLFKDLEEHMVLHTDETVFVHTRKDDGGVCDVFHNSMKKTRKKRKPGDCTYPCTGCEENPCKGILPFQCSLCQEIVQLGRLEHHLDYFCAKKPFQCPECLKRFDNESLLVAHSQSHTTQQAQQCPEDRAFHCHTCQKRFIGENNLEEHKKSHEKEIFYHCRKCPEKFRRKVELRNHQHAKHSDKRFVCPLCEKRFSQQSNYNEHLRIHTGEKPYKCDRCSQSFNKRKSLVQHIRTHTGEKPYQCECGKQYSQLGSLIEHRRIHTGETPFVCSECNRNFTSKSNLRAHLLRHGQVSPSRFPCFLCKKKYKYKGDLVKHLTKIHNESKESVDTMLKRVPVNRISITADMQGYVKKLRVDFDQSLAGESAHENNCSRISQVEEEGKSPTAESNSHKNQNGQWNFLHPSLVKEEPPDEVSDADLVMTEGKDQGSSKISASMTIKEDNMSASDFCETVFIKEEDVDDFMAIN